MYRDNELTIEEEDEIINMIAQKIQEHGLDIFAILIIEGLKPLSFIGANMGSLFVAPFLYISDEKAGHGVDKLFQIFENRDNVDKLLDAIEKMSKEDEERNKIEKAKKLEGKKTHNKKWWQRFFTKKI